MSRNEKSRIRKSISVGAVCLFFIMLICGCGKQEMKKTILLPDEAEDGTERINVKNIQEYTYEDGVINITWSNEAAGKLCMIKGEENRDVFQYVDVYQKTVSEEIIFEENMVGYIRISPGGKYIAYENMAGEVRELVVYEAESGKKKVLMEWNDISAVYTLEWSDDGTKLLVWMEVEESRQNQNVSKECIIYCYDMESEEKAVSQVCIPIRRMMWRGIFPNKDASRVFIEETYYGVYDEWGEEKDALNYEVSEEDELYIDETEAKEKRWVVDMESMDVREVDVGRINIGEPLKYTDCGLFYMDEGKLWLAREPLGQVSGKRLMEAERGDVYICEKGDHIFLIEKEDDGGYIQVTGFLLEDGEIQEYQVLYKGIDGGLEQTFAKAFIGMDDHELVICSMNQERWSMNIKVLEY